MPGTGALLKAVDDSTPESKNAQLCEAHFFIGLRKSKLGDKKQAAAHFQKSLETKSAGLSAYRGAQFQLQALAISDAKAQP